MRNSETGRYHRPEPDAFSRGQPEVKQQAQNWMQRFFGKSSKKAAGDDDPMKDGSI